MYIKQRKIMNHIVGILLILIFASLVSACSDKPQGKPKLTTENEKPTTSPSKVEETWKLPITTTEGEFYKTGGWISDSQLLYITNLEQTSSVYRYNLLTGVSEFVYKSEVPIVTLQVSPSKKYILIQSTPSTYEGIITIVSLDGTLKARQAFPSYELGIEWNPFDESKIMVTSFNSDWTFQIQLLNIENDDLTDLFLPQPFIKWLNQDEVAFLNWDDTSPTLTAQLVKMKVGEEVKELLPSVLQFSTYRDLLMTVTVNNSDKSQAIYSFYDKELNEFSSYSIPHLSMFSGWLVPFFDYNESKEQFITFKPMRSAEADAYHEGFELVSFDIKEGKNKSIIGGLKNEPLALDPSGNFALYGNKFEKIIDLETKKIIDLVKE